MSLSLGCSSSVINEPLITNGQQKLRAKFACITCMHVNKSLVFAQHLVDNSCEALPFRFAALLLGNPNLK